MKEEGKTRKTTPWKLPWNRATRSAPPADRYKWSFLRPPINGRKDMGFTAVISPLQMELLPENGADSCTWKCPRSMKNRKASIFRFMFCFTYDMTLGFEKKPHDGQKLCCFTGKRTRFSENQGMEDVKDVVSYFQNSSLLGGGCFRLMLEAPCFPPAAPWLSGSLYSQDFQGARSSRSLSPWRPTHTNTSPKD